MVEFMADFDEKWEESLVGKDQWINKPAQPPGLLRSGAAIHFLTCALLDGHSGFAKPS